MFCKECGVKNEEGVAFCVNCGAKLTSKSTSSNNGEIAMSLPLASI